MQAIVLGAGLSRRMGEQKLLLPFGKSTILETVLDNLLLSGIMPVILVLSAYVADRLPHLGELSDLKIIINSRPEDGQASSLKLGLETLLPEPFCLMCADLPMVKPHEISEMKALFQDRKGCTGAVPYRDGRFGHPVFMEYLWVKRLMSVEGDRGGRDVLMKHKDELLLSAAHDSFFYDVDTPEEYEKLMSKI